MLYLNINKNKNLLANFQHFLAAMDTVFYFTIFLYQIYRMCAKSCARVKVADHFFFKSLRHAPDFLNKYLKNKNNTYSMRPI